MLKCRHIIEETPHASCVRRFFAGSGIWAFPPVRNRKKAGILKRRPSFLCNDSVDDV